MCAAPSPRHEASPLVHRTHRGGGFHARVAADRIIDAVGSRQHGVVARRQLLNEGLSDRMIDRRLRSGHLVREYSGVYRVGGAPTSQLADWMAAVFAAGQEARLSHLSAAHLWGLVDRSGLPHVTRRSGGVGSGRICVHHCPHMFVDEGAVERDIPVTTVARTLADLAGSLGERRLSACLNEARRLEIFDLGEMRRLMARQPNRRGLGTLKKLVDRIDPELLPTRSELEDLFLALCIRAGLPLPERNIVLDGFEIDCIWPDRKLIVELDGYRYHHHRRELDTARDLYFLERGFQTIRITYRTLMDRPEKVVRVLREALTRA